MSSRVQDQYLQNVPTALDTPGFIERTAAGIMHQKVILNATLQSVVKRSLSGATSQKSPNN
jgi:hypothetical protein